MASINQVLTHQIEMEDRIMAKLTDIAAALATVEATVQAEKAQATQVVADLKGIVATLQQQLADGGTPEERADLLARIEALIPAVQLIVEPEV